MKDMRNLVRGLLPCFAAALCLPNTAEHLIFTEALTCAQSIIDFTLIAQYQSDTHEMIQYLEQYLMAFYHHKDVFKEYRKDKSTEKKVHEVTARIRKLEGIVADKYDEEVEFNFVKLHLLSYFAHHIWRFGNIQVYSTEFGESSQKMIIKENYRRSNKNDASYQILQIYARLNSFKIHKMNVNTDEDHSKVDIQRSKPDLRQIGSYVRQWNWDGLRVRTAAQFNGALRDLPRLLVDYYRRKPAGQSTFDDNSIPELPIEICHLLRVPVKNFQDPGEVTWHILHCTGKQLWKST
ncbi:hypothetical protein HOY82DRAFT_614502 [Tuber indicum]|nr:hypothetical protein HOY82DRAFT_614502 [Tuber indicum]